MFIPSDRKELRSKFLQKVNADDQLNLKGAEVKGGRDGLFVEKPDIINKYCRRKITPDNPELGALSLMRHFPSIHVAGIPIPPQKVAIEFRLYSSARIV